MASHDDITVLCNGRTMQTYSRRTVLFQSSLAIAAAQNAVAPRYDLLVRGGHVIDPSQNLSAVRDIPIARGKVARTRSPACASM